MRPSAALACLALLVSGLPVVGCVPYAVGTTPAVVAPQDVEPSVTLQAVSSRRDLDDDDDGPKGAGLTIANAARLGLDGRSDIGVQLTGIGGLTATYKRRLSGAGDQGASVIVGGGIVGTSHLHVEATLVASPGPLAVAPLVTPYGGVRVQDLTPFSDGLASGPAVGLFVGGRFGWPDLAVSPELGLFYSPSPLAGDNDVVVVPSVTIRGERIRRALGI